MSSIHGQSHKAVKYFRDTPAALAIYWIYVSRANHENVAWPSIRGLRTDTGWSTDPVMEARAWLVEHEALEEIPDYVRPKWRKLEPALKSRMLNLDKSQYFRPTGKIVIDGREYSLLYYPGSEDSEIDEPPPDPSSDVPPNGTSTPPNIDPAEHPPGGTERITSISELDSNDSKGDTSNTNTFAASDDTAEGAPILDTNPVKNDSPENSNADQQPSEDESSSPPAPVATPSSSPVPPAPSSQKEPDAEHPKKRKAAPKETSTERKPHPNEPWRNALLKCFGMTPETVTKTGDIPYWKAAAEMKSINLPVEAIPDLYDWCGKKGWSTFSVMAMSKYAGEFLVTWKPKPQFSDDGEGQDEDPMDHLRAIQAANQRPVFELSAASVPVEQVNDWAKAYSQLEIQFDNNTWVFYICEKVQLVSVDGNVWSFVTISQYVADMLQHRLYREIRRVLGDTISNRDIELKFSVAETADHEPQFT